MFFFLDKSSPTSDRGCAKLSQSFDEMEVWFCEETFKTTLFSRYLIDRALLLEDIQKAVQTGNWMQV